MKPILLEVCIESVDDAVTAGQCGADRIELNSALSLDGITPSLGLLQEVRARIGPKLPVMAMVRPRAGDFCYSEAEFSTMRRDVDLLLAHGAGGIVFGILTADRCVDIPRCRQLTEQVLGNPAATEGAVFHRAFDCVAEPLAEIDALAALGVRRILTSGQRTTAIEGADEIARYIRHAADRIEILPGAGVRPENVRELVLRTGCRQVHGSFRERQQSPGTAARGTSARLVREVLQQLKSCS